MKKNLHILVVGVYLALTLGAYVSVFKASPDGLANIPLVIVNFPLIVIERTLTNTIYGSMDRYLWEPLVKSMGLPSSYYFNQLYRFLPISILQAYLLFLLAKWIKNKRR